MKVKDAVAYKRWHDINTDPYGSTCLKFGEAWANEMEKLMAKGKKLETIADDTSHKVDKRPEFGITGFMYGAAVCFLSKCWLHGEELRKWHNLKTQIHDEGRKANDKGGVLNPALIEVGKDDGS